MAGKLNFMYQNMKTIFLPCKIKTFWRISEKNLASETNLPLLLTSHTKKKKNDFSKPKIPISKISEQNLKQTSTKKVLYLVSK